jgi:NADPH-dependent FMN reductase
MSWMRILSVSGSPSPTSWSRRLLSVVGEALGRRGCHVDLIDLREAAFPLLDTVAYHAGGSYPQARATWERFRDSVFEQDAKFVKHHAYRAGGLRIKAGDEAGGVAELGESLRRCVELADDFHECEIAIELGTLLLRRGDATAAARHYDQGAAAATRLGDPYRMAVAEIGRAATARPRRAPATDVLGSASACLVQPERMHALIEGCQSGTDLMSLLPSPRTKLNRPFDLVAR